MRFRCSPASLPGNRQWLNTRPSRLGFRPMDAMIQATLHSCEFSDYLRAAQFRQDRRNRWRQAFANATAILPNGRYICKATVDVQVMPKLRREHADEAHLDRSSLCRAGSQFGTR